MQKASVHAATFSHLCHIEPHSGWFGHRRGEETAPCLGCLRRLPPEGGVPGSRVETALCLAARGGEAGARAGLALNGRKNVEGAAIVTIFRTCFLAVSSLSLEAIRSSRPFALPTARWFWGGLVALVALTARCLSQFPLLPDYKIGD